MVSAVLPETQEETWLGSVSSEVTLGQTRERIPSFSFGGHTSNSIRAKPHLLVIFPNRLRIEFPRWAMGTSCHWK